MVGLDRNKHAGSLSNAKRNVQIQVKTGLLGAYEDTRNSANTGPGKCFPSGHASTVFMWIVLLYSPLPWLTNRRSRMCILLFSAGLLAGGVQVIKGAHFLSHILATAWNCWGVTLICREVYSSRVVFT
ncbi:MAG: phosphatase PAP2 family protein [Gammaproteobacteria bacterium]|nr:phosphatase PAP2 family protein [Gammaproteobacteria bacterium]MBU0848346.1 phosphatase PAP2 family protein [Gammaproteobacteria bacterium]MBU1530477.1 phosphatase PAP2 family protein [Gammaproteobacteria bacterium]MBU1780445.1 phosphatase PAP2 family protein [Gammaproteobacteria bacterium]MBU2088055.1 phosphatase PAP2 family protein [Gammaproteobacteria bacterium]